MKHNHILTSLMMAALAAMPATAQISLVNPVPQKVVSTGKFLNTLPKTWKIVTNEQSNNEVYETALVMLEKAKVSPLYKSKYTLTLGVKGDKCISKVAKLIPNHAEGYYLNISEKGIVIAGADKAGLILSLIHI